MAEPENEGFFSKAWNWITDDKNKNGIGAGIYGTGQLVNAFTNWKLGKKQIGLAKEQLNLAKNQLDIENKRTDEDRAKEKSVDEGISRGVNSFFEARQ